MPMRVIQYLNNALAGTDMFLKRALGAAAGISALAASFWAWQGDDIKGWFSRELGLGQMAEVVARLENQQAQSIATQEKLAVTQEQLTQSQERLQASMVQQQDTIATIGDGLAKLSTITEQRISQLENDIQNDRTPPVRYLEEGNLITNGAIGGFVTFTVKYVKTRDCGRPVQSAFFRNGGGIVHAFRDLSTTADDGRGNSAPVSSEVQTGRFIARIPADEGVQPTVGGQGNDGYAVGWVLLSWPNCPRAPEVRSPLIPFQIHNP